MRPAHDFKKRSFNPIDENGNEGCATCGRARDLHRELTAKEDKK